MMAPPRIGFVGLGVMGQPMALHLAHHGPLAVYNRTPERMEPLLAAGAEAAGSPGEIGERCAIVFLMLKDDDAVQAVAGSLLSLVTPGTLIVDHSTISPSLTRRLAEQASAVGAEWLDAPVTGGDMGARAASLTIMVGGSGRAFDRVEPYLKLMGKRIVHVGDVGQGQSLKLVANLVSAVNLMAASEGIQMGRRLGLSLADMETVMQHGSAQSFELGKVLERWSTGNYAPGFSVDNRHKDLRLAMDLAVEAKFKADLGTRAEQLYRQHKESGFATEDETSYIKRWDESGG